jgi:hypothetical protein
VSGCAIAWNAYEVNPVSGLTVLVNAVYRGNCAQAQSIAAAYPGAVVVQAPASAASQSGCSATGTETCPTGTDPATP